MGISKRILDLARANLNALLDRTGGDTPVDEWTDEELEAELRRRRERRRREERERQKRMAAEEAARKRAAERRSQGSTGQARQYAEARGKSARTAPPPDGRLRALYAQLEVPYGAPFEEVKRNFRRLMRKYHPDLHTGNPAKHEAATKLTMALTQAYDELERYLVKGGCT